MTENKNVFNIENAIHLYRNLMDALPEEDQQKFITEINEINVIYMKLSE